MSYRARPTACSTPRPTADPGDRARSRLRRVGVLAAAGLLTLLAACSAGSGADGGAQSGAGEEQDELVVLAASSLTEVFTTLAATFEEQHPGVRVTTSFGSSTDLAEQAADGAPGDVLATADATAMGVAQDAGVVRAPQGFAANTLALVVPPGNPAGITSLEDLAGTTWVRCADEVPCGRMAAAVLADAGVSAEPVSLEEDVKSALEKVTSGEADAALVYASDAVAAGDAVRTLEIPGAEGEATTYLMATLEQTGSPTLAAEWNDLVLSEEGRSALQAAGFSVQ